MQTSNTRRFRSLLFAPGSRPERFDKAARSGADAICLDLEDGVLPADKAEARDHVRHYLRTRAAVTGVASDSSPVICVRINSVRTHAGLVDLLTLAALDASPDFVVIPKVESAAELEVVRSALAEERTASGPPPLLIALVETLRGIEAVMEIGRAPDVAMIGIGTADLALQMDVSMDWEPLLLARLQVVQAAKSAGIQALDGAWLQLDDANGLDAEARRAAALGYTAKICLHPKQIETIHSALGPTVADLQEARATIAAFENGEQGAMRVDGKMVDLPIVEAARRTLARGKPNEGR